MNLARSFGGQLNPKRSVTPVAEPRRPSLWLLSGRSHKVME